MITFYPTDNIELIRDFYENRLGLELYKSQNGGKTLIFDGGNGYIGFSQTDDGRYLLGGDKGVCISFVLENTESVNAKFAELTARGILAEAEPKLLEGFGVYSFFLRDPDDRRLEIQCFTD